MPLHHLNLKEFVCDFCGEKDRIDFAGDSGEIRLRVARWRGILDPLARDETQGRGAPASTKWYDSVDCLCKGVKHDQEASELEATVGSACEGPMVAVR